MSAARRFTLTVMMLAACRQPREPFQVLEFTPPPHGLIVGRPGAGPVVVEFGSHTCPACRQLVDSVWPALDEQYLRSNRLQYQYLEAGHVQADPLAAFVECEATKQGVLQSRARLNWLINHAKDSLPRLLDASSCPDAEARRIRRQSERTLAESMRIRGTPTIIS
jgi:protein-disulfide isomerase